MPLPNFLVIGAPKCGTTSLWAYLDAHPQVYMSPVKEPCFFLYADAGLEDAAGRERIAREIERHRQGTPELVTDFPAFQSLFDGVTTETAIGEASTTYIIYPNAAARIQHYIPDVKLIAVLRQPVERAYSAFWELHRAGLTPFRDFAQAACSEEVAAPLPDAWEANRFLRVGLYTQRLQPFFDRFRRDQIKIFLYDDLEADSLRVTQECYRFLGVDGGFVPDVSKRHNVGSNPRNVGVFRAYRQAAPILRAVHHAVPAPVRRWSKPLQKKLLYRETPPLSPELAERLKAFFRDDILRLQDLLQRDLSHWLKSSAVS